jgi:hypothetical protein
MTAYGCYTFEHATQSIVTIGTALHKATIFLALAQCLG